MDCGSRQESVGRNGLLQIEDCLDAIPPLALPRGVTLISLIDRNIANVGESVAYRYLDYTRSVVGHAVELTWTQLGIRLRAIGAHLQQVTARGDHIRVTNERHRNMTDETLDARTHLPIPTPRGAV
jgi:fatty-acyl-CoA synthase